MQDRIDTERLILEFDITNEELADAAHITLYTASRWEEVATSLEKFAPYLLSRGFWSERLLRPRLSGILGNSKRRVSRLCLARLLTCS